MTNSPSFPAGRRYDRKPRHREFVPLPLCGGRRFGVRIRALREARNLSQEHVARSLPDAALRNNGRESAVEEIPPALFSRSFVEVIGLAIDEGHVSVRRVAGLLDLSVESLAELFTTHGVACPFDL